MDGAKNVGSQADRRQGKTAKTGSAREDFAIARLTLNKLVAPAAALPLYTGRLADAGHWSRSAEGTVQPSAVPLWMHRGLRCICVGNWIDDKHAAAAQYSKDLFYRQLGLCFP